MVTRDHGGGIKEGKAHPEEAQCLSWSKTLRSSPIFRLERYGTKIGLVGPPFGNEIDAAQLFHATPHHLIRP